MSTTPHTPPLPTPDDLSLAEIARRFPDEEKAIAYLEALRWPDGVICPRCGNNAPDRLYKLASNRAKKIRAGLRHCLGCNRQFRVTIGTIFEDSHIPLNQWLIAWYLLCGAKKGMSALQLQRHLGLGSYRSAWFMAHRIRHAMKDPGFTSPLNGVVEVDETYVGGKSKDLGRSTNSKVPVVALVERDGRVRTHVVKRVTADTLKGAIIGGVNKHATIITDEFPAYRGLDKHFSGGHHTVCHAKKEYSRGWVSTNTVEGFFSLIKRGVYGSFHHVSEKHLHRYCAEFSFRWDHRKTTDGERMVIGLKRAWGRRLTYKPLVAGGRVPKKEKPVQPFAGPGRVNGPQMRKKRGTTSVE